MLVRNNIKCPRCGKIAAMDIHIGPFLPFTQDRVILRAECTECLAFCERRVSWPIIRCWLILLVNEKGWYVAGTWGLPLKWSKTMPTALSRRQKLAIQRSASLWFDRGMHIGDVADSHVLCDIYRKLVTSGSPLSSPSAESLSYAWRRL
jgi:hypothetical protein